MIIEELKEEEMYVMVAPDGNPQPMTLAPDLAMCVALIKMLHKKGVMESYFSCTQSGCKILPVKVTITQNGTEEEGFQRSKQKM